MKNKGLKKHRIFEEENLLYIECENKGIRFQFRSGYILVFHENEIKENDGIDEFLRFIVKKVKEIGSLLERHPNSSNNVIIDFFRIHLAYEDETMGFYVKTLMHGDCYFYVTSEEKNKEVKWADVNIYDEVLYEKIKKIKDEILLQII